MKRSIFSSRGFFTLVLSAIPLSGFATHGGETGEAACSPTGPQHALVIGVDFPDIQSSTSLATLQTVFLGTGTNNDSLRQYWNEVSYGKTDVTGDVVGRYMLNITQACSADGAAIRSAALEAAIADGVDVTQYNRILIHMPPGTLCNGWPANASFASIGCTTLQTTIGAVTASTSWDRTTGRPTVSHEAGHNLGLIHAWSEDFGTGASLGPLGTDGTQTEYGDMFDVMGGLVSFMQSHHNAFYKHQLGLLEDTDITRVTASGSYRVYPLTNTGTGSKAIRILRGAVVRDISPGVAGYYNPEDLALAYEHFWIETRRDEGFDAKLDDSRPEAASAFGGLLIRRTSGILDGGRALLVDATPGSASGQNDFLDAPLAPGQVFVDTATGLSIRHDGVDPADGSVLVTVTFDPARIDSDEDGLLDTQEVSIGTDPASFDTDGDGVSDGQEVCFDADCSSYDPVTADLDALVPDSDGDGMPDGWEWDYRAFSFSMLGTQPLVADAGVDLESDGLTNLQEYQAGTSPKLADSDFDGLTDGDEVARQTNPLDPDTDDDGMQDSWEVNNGFDPLDPADATQDSDTDGITNLVEYQHGTDPHATDTDQDGLSDGDEVNVYHTSPTLPDTDQDGVWDYKEILKGSDPNDPTSLPAGLDGDLNSDGVVDIKDALLVQRLVLGSLSATPEQLLAADVYPQQIPDSTITFSDILLIHRMALGL